jgi:glycosyltransferase involved in cell wall biosynthesis
MKIAIVYDPIYPFIIGGGEKRNWEVAIRLAKQEFQVYIVGMKFWKGKNEIVKNGVHIRGICPAIPFFNKKGKRSIYEPIYFGFFVFLHLLRNSYDIIDCANFPYISAIAAKFAGFLKKKNKLFITWHEVWGKEYWLRYAGWLGRVGWIVEKLVSKVTNHNIFVSSFMEQRGESILGVKRENRTIISNGVECKRLSKSENIQKENQAIFIGRIVKHKRVDMLIEAFKDIVNETKENLILKIIGEGPEKQKMVELSEKLKLKDKVLFSGFMKKEEVEREMKKSKIFVLPSELEGMGIVIIEAMASGTAVIAADSQYSAAKCIIDNGVNGLLINNKEDLKNAILKLLSDEELYNRIVEKGHRTTMNYDWDNVIIPQLIEYYQH